MVGEELDQFPRRECVTDVLPRVDVEAVGGDQDDVGAGLGPVDHDDELALRADTPAIEPELLIERVGVDIILK